MADKTGIEWTDATWNPTTGCDKISAGRDNCYAPLKQAGRLQAMGSPRYLTDGNPVTSGPGFGIAIHDAAEFYQPLRWSRPRKIFVNSMSDLFHAKVDRFFVARVYAVMLLCPRHVFQILTKRPSRMRRVLTDPAFPGMVASELEHVVTASPVKISDDAVTAACG